MNLTHSYSALKLYENCPYRYYHQRIAKTVVDKGGEASQHELPEKGIKKVMVIAPGFSADCLETLEEIEGENREHFMHHGGEKFAYVPCLNDSEEGLDVIQSVVLRELQGWI